MKVILLAAITADGYIARTSNQLATAWTTREDKRLFTRVTKAAGTMVMGWNTFATIGHALPGRRLLVLVNPERPAPATVEDVEFFSGNASELNAKLVAEGVRELVVCGGAAIYDQYMHAGLIDELYISVQPKLFGSGLQLFKTTLDLDLNLIDTETYPEDGTVVLHYSVHKNEAAL